MGCVASREDGGEEATTTSNQSNNASRSDKHSIKARAPAAAPSRRAAPAPPVVLPRTRVKGKGRRGKKVLARDTTRTRAQSLVTELVERKLEGEEFSVVLRELSNLAGGVLRAWCLLVHAA